MPAPEAKDTLIPASGTRPLKALAMAANAGDAEAQFELGYRYLTGQDVARDERRTYTLWRKSAGSGHSASMNNLGWLHANGRAVPQDDKAAFSCYRKAAALDNQVGQLNLGRMYLDGRGTAHNPAKARLWIKLAAQHGNTDAQALLKAPGLAGGSPVLRVVVMLVLLLIWSAVYVVTLATPAGAALTQLSEPTRIVIQSAPVWLPFVLLFVYFWRRFG